MINKQVIKIIRQEWIELRSNSTIIWLLYLVPIFFGVIVPIVLLGTNVKLDLDIVKLLFKLLYQVDIYKDQFMAERRMVLYIITIFLMLPLFMMMPVIISISIANRYFDEMKMLDNLGDNPISLKSLLLGKMLAAAIPSIVNMWVAVVSYSLIANYYFSNYIYRVAIFPNLIWLVVCLIVTPCMVCLFILLVFALSQHAKTIRLAKNIAIVLCVVMTIILTSQCFKEYTMVSMKWLIAAVLLIILNIMMFSLVHKNLIK